MSIHKKIHHKRIHRFIWGIIGVSMFIFLAPNGSTLFLFQIVEPATAEETGAETEQVILRIDGMSCFTCTWGIEDKLKNLPGIIKADVTLKRKTWWNPFSATEGKAFITYEAGAVTIDQLIETIEQASDAVYTYTAVVFSHE